MCRFASAILMFNGDLLYNENFISHEDLIDFFKIRDNQFNQDKFIRLEFKPENNEDYIDINKYELVVDENSIPDWFEKYRKITANKMKSLVEKQIIKTNQKILTGGVYIVCKDVVIDKVINATIEYNYGTVTNNHGTVTYNNNSGTVTNNHGTVTYNNNSGTVTINYGTVTYNNGIVTYNNGIVTYNYGTVTYNHGTVTYNHGTVTYNSGTVTYNSGTVTNTYNYGTVTNNHGTVTMSYNNGTVIYDTSKKS